MIKLFTSILSSTSTWLIFATIVVFMTQKIVLNRGITLEVSSIKLQSKRNFSTPTPTPTPKPTPRPEP